MKQFKHLILGGLLLSMSLSSCIVYQEHHATTNPVGTKVGIAKTKFFKKDQDISLKAAAANGKIDRIATVDLTVKNYLIINITSIVITGN